MNVSLSTERKREKKKKGGEALLGEHDMVPWLGYGSRQARNTLVDAS